MQLKVVSSVLDAQALTLFCQDGTSVIIKQGDPKLADILAQVMPVVARGEIATINYEADQDVYAKFEELTKKMVQFMEGTASRFEKLENLIERISKGVSAEATTVTAVVKKPDGKVDIIPNAENLVGQLNAAVERKEPAGVIALMDRMAKLAKKREFSVEHLLKFINHAKLQVADNGDLIVFKALNQRGQDFVDIHSGTVIQNVGTKVFMDEARVDKNAMNACSVGLHIASVNYLKQFTGAACFIASVNPEDCIAVPHADGTKMRVCAYTLLKQLTQEQYRHLLNKSDVLTMPEVQETLGPILAATERPFHKTAFVTPNRETKYETVGEKPAEQAKAEPKKVAKVVKASKDRKVEVAPVDVKKVGAKSEKDLSPEQKKALKMVRANKTVSEASKATGIHRRSIDRLIIKYGK